jgi:hypothetical protein
MKSGRLLTVAFLLTVAARPCWGQFVRPPVIVPRPPVHVPVHVPHVPHAPGGKDSDRGVSGWVIGGVAALAGLGGGGYLIHRWRRRSARRAVIRITAPPPGEVPEFVRRAWVGLELPLIQGQTRVETMTAQEVLSRHEVNALPGYAVDGKTAVEILASANPEVARWWRENAPDILAPGYQLVFAAEVCERLDDLGT